MTPALAESVAGPPAHPQHRAHTGLLGLLTAARAVAAVTVGVARLGGEEFLVGLAGADPAQALALAERLRAAVANCSHPLKDGQVLHCTVSIGVSGVLQQRAAWEAALRDADAALYRAKQAGRNRVVAANEAVPAQNPQNQ